MRAWRDDNLLAIQIPGPIEDLKQDIRQIVENRNPDYLRGHIREPGLSVAAVNAKDIVDPDQLDDRSATSWIKMHEVGIDGLRQAFLDPGSRIRLNSKDGKFEPEKHMELVSLGWEGGFLSGESVCFNPNLNVLVGGRGTGKSTIIESIRTVLDLAPISEGARKAHDGIVSKVLRNGTRISLRVRVQRPRVHEYLIERTIPNPPLVREGADKEVLHLAPTDVLSRVEAYGQHEILELAKRPEKITRLLDRFVEGDDSLPGRKTSLRNDLSENRRALCDIRGRIESAEERLAALPGLEKTLERFQDAGLESRLRDRSLLLRKERVLGSVPDRLAPFREALDLLRREIPIDSTFLSERALAELPNREVLSGTNRFLSDLGKEIEWIADDLMHSLERADHGIDQVQTAWEGRRQRIQKEYERTLRKLQESRVDGEEFIRLRRKIEELRPLQDRLSQLRQSETELNEQRSELLEEWEDIKATEKGIFDRAARKVSKKLAHRVQVEVTSSDNREPLFKILREEIGGRMAETEDSLSNFPDFSLAKFVEACRSGDPELLKTYGIPPKQADRLAAGEPEMFMRIEELDLELTTSIRLNTAPTGKSHHWQSLEDLPSGQRATAVLLLLLLESGAPLIIDQPEDDLDNRFITESVVPRIREEKQQRQFIFSTHNANIPVLSGAELILGLSAAGDADSGRAHVAPEHAGSIDSRTVRELVGEILEGGREAFGTRRRKYGF